MKRNYEQHGMTGHPVHRAWVDMKARCQNPNSASYKNYGARGITVCERWLHSFPNFLEDMGERPKGLTLERINNDSGYYPDNCRWATWSDQNSNKRAHGAVPFRGVWKRGNKYRAGIKKAGISTYLGTYDTPEEAGAVYEIAKENRK